MKWSNWGMYVFLCVAIIIAVIIIYLLAKEKSFENFPSNQFRSGDSVVIRSFVADSQPLAIQGGCTFGSREKGDPYLKGNCLISFTGEDQEFFTFNHVLHGVHSDNDEIKALSKGFGNRLYLQDPRSTTFYVLNRNRTPEMGDAVTFVYIQDAEKTKIRVGGKFTEDKDFLWGVFFEPAILVSDGTVSNKIFRAKFDLNGKTDRPNNAVGKVWPGPVDPLDDNNSFVDYNIPSISVWSSTSDITSLEYLFLVEGQ